MSELYCIHFIKNLFLPAGSVPSPSHLPWATTASAGAAWWCQRWQLCLNIFCECKLGSHGSSSNASPPPLFQPQISPQPSPSAGCHDTVPGLAGHLHQSHLRARSVGGGSDVARAVIMVSESQSSPASATSLHPRRRTFSEQKEDPGPEDTGEVSHGTFQW